VTPELLRRAADAAERRVSLAAIYVAELVLVWEGRPPILMQAATQYRKEADRADRLFDAWRRADQRRRAKVLGIVEMARTGNRT